MKKTKLSFEVEEIKSLANVEGQGNYGTAGMTPYYFVYSLTVFQKTRAMMENFYYLHSIQTSLA